MQRPVLRASHIPERSVGWQPPLEREPAQQEELAFHARPLKLLDRAERIAVLYASPDGYPRRFRWRGSLFDVARVEGPERIAPEWWREKGATRLRDYYRVEDADGPPLLDLPRGAGGRRAGRGAGLVLAGAVRVRGQTSGGPPANAFHPTTVSQCTAIGGQTERVRQYSHPQPRPSSATASRKNGSKKISPRTPPNSNACRGCQSTKATVESSNARSGKGSPATGCGNSAARNSNSSPSAGATNAMSASRSVAASNAGCQSHHLAGDDYQAEERCQHTNSKSCAAPVRHTRHGAQGTAETRKNAFISHPHHLSIQHHPPTPMPPHARCARTAQPWFGRSA